LFFISKSNTLAAVISGLAANGMKTLVVCEKKTPLDILQQKLGEISSYNEWPASKFSAVITNVEERDDLVTKAQQNRLAVDTLSSESIAEYESMLINEVHRLEKDIVFEEDRFVRHRASTKAGVGFGMSFQDAVAWNIDHVLSGNTILPIIDGSLLLTSVFAPDHVKRIDRCEAQLGKEIVDALLLLEFKKITEFTADDVIAQAAELKDEIKKLLNHRHTILLKVKADIIAKYDVLCEVWNDRLTDLTKIASELRRIPAVAIEQFERGGWGETLFAFLTNSTQHRGVLRALSGRLNSIKAEINQRSQESPPGDFSLSNMQRIVHWCKGRLLHVETIGKNLTDKSLQHMWEENVFMIKHEMKTSHEELELVKYAMKNAIQNSLFCTAHSLTQFTLCFDILNTTESGWALDKLFLLFKNSNLSQWRSSADSINCLLSFGLLQDHNFLALFLGCKKTVSWGTRIKSAILSRELATKEDLMTSDFVLNKISDSMSQIRRNIQLLVVLRQAKAMKESVANFEANSCPRQKFEQLFNRASRNIRTNSLLEIVKELDLFTSCFPILFCTPEVASTLFKGVYGYFDLVVLDEASQSLPQETFACLLKGKKAILAGDRHQMPPTILFGGGGGVNILDLLDDETPEGNEMHYDSVEEVKSKQYIHRITQNAANAESILDFATDHSFYFAPVDLKFHYRSMNPDLMGFNAAAIYKNLALCPGKPIISARPAIQVTRVNGIYKDRSNRIEAEKILSILKKYVVGLDDESTIAIATFNESQQKMILNLLKHHPDHQFIMSIRTLQSQNRFFVKNLENLQGDEVDHLIIGTTFGPTSSGKFEKRFGRITFQGLGYRYLNVLFSRARQHVHIVTSIPPCEFMNAEMVREDNGQLSGLSFFYGYLRYATAISSGNRILAEQLLVEFNPENRSRPKEAIGSLEQVIGNHLRSRHSKYERLVNGEARSNSLLKGMMVRFDNGKCMVLESNTYESYSNCIYRKTILESFGYSYYHIWLKNWLDSPMNELVKLCQVVDDSIRKNRVVNPIIDAGDESRSSSPVSFQMNVIVSDEDSPTNKREMDDYADDDDVLMSDDGAYSSKAAKRQKCTNDVWDPKEMPEEEAVESFALNEPYLVKYGTHRKLIVFIPLAIVKRRGSRMLQGQWGTQQLRFPVHRLTPIASAPKNIKPDLFLNPVEFDKLKFYTSSTDTPPRSKMSTRASLSRSSGI